MQGGDEGRSTGHGFCGGVAPARLRLGAAEHVEAGVEGGKVLSEQGAVPNDPPRCQEVVRRRRLAGVGSAEPVELPIVTEGAQGTDQGDRILIRDGAEAVSPGVGRPDHGGANRVASTPPKTRRNGRPNASRSASGQCALLTRIRSGSKACVTRS